MTVPVQSLDTSRPRVGPAVIAAMILAPAGALICSLINFGMAVAGVEAVPLRTLFSTPVASPIPFRPLGSLGTFVGLIVLAAAVLLIVSLTARAADRRHGFAAVLFGGWLATILGGWVAALLSSPLVLIDFRYPPELIGQVLLQRIGAGGGWGLYWGWITGLVAALIFRATNRRP
jgi:hypothetical protein